MKVQAIRVGDDDDRRITPITPAQVRQWLDQAEIVYAPINLKFEFVPDKDFSELRSTAINSIMPWTIDQREALRPTILRMRSIAESYPGRMVVFFRYGDRTIPTGNGFSWWDYNFIAAPAFDATTVCGHQNGALLAHEIGHYLGLPHTFGPQFGTVVEAQTAFVNGGRDPAIFDGDQIPDTPPDPFISQLQCGRETTVTLDGRVLPLARDNLMSYYDSPQRTLSPLQQSRALWLLDWRSKNRMDSPRNLPGPITLEVDSMPYIGAVGVSFRTRQEMIGFGWFNWIDDDQLFVRGSPGAWINLNLKVPETKLYQISLCATFAPDFAVIRTEIDGQIVGSTIDLYAPCVLSSGAIPLGSASLSKGDHQLRFRVIGKNLASTAYAFGVDALVLNPTKPNPQPLEPR